MATAAGPRLSPVEPRDPWTAGIDAAATRILSSLAARDTAASSVWVSPILVGVQLLMLASSVGPEASAEILTALGMSSSSASDTLLAALSRMKEVMLCLTARLPGKAATMAVAANSVWLRDDMSWNDAFVAAMRRDFDADVGSVPHTTLSGDGINAWVRDKTAGAIPRMVGDTLHPGFACALVNALYFNGAWESAFNESATQHGVPFYSSDGRTQTGRVSLMKCRDGLCKHAVVAEVGNVALLPYKPAARTSFTAIIVLPPLNTTPESVVATIERTGGVQALMPLVRTAGSTAVNLHVPRFDAAFNADIRTEVTALGVRRAFDASGNGATSAMLSPSCPVPLAVSTMAHSYFVRVDEQGTVMAMAALVRMTYGASGPSSVVRCDRPFLFYVLGHACKTMLLSGIVRLPQSGGP